MVEEIEDIKDRLDTIQTWSLATAKDLEACQSEIDSLKSETRCSYSKAEGAAKELSVFQDEIQDVKMEIKSFKNLFVCLIVLALCYWFLM